MIRTKKAIVGKKTAPGIIEVESKGKKELVKGQRVLIYKPTGKAIVGSSGRTIGQKERVLGIGEVAVIDDKVVIKTPQVVSCKRIRSPKGAVKALNKSYRLKSCNLRSHKLKMDTQVYIKPVEE